MDKNKQHTGRVKFYNHKSKFGFIIVNETQQEIYVKEANLLDDIADGDTIVFNIIEAKRGSEAIAVTKTK